MIIPSIDIQSGAAVQLVGGKEKKIDAGDPRPLARKFGRVGEIAVIDLDAAMGVGDNEELITELLQLAPCRVGGGIRSAEDALKWLERGATRVILGTAATPEILSQIPRERVIAALDQRDGAVLSHGWTQSTSDTVSSRMRQLREFVGGFLVTFVETEGRMCGLPFDTLNELKKEAGDAALTLAGGVATTGEIKRADDAGVDIQIGMALYSGRVDLAQGFLAPVTSDRPDNLIPTIVQEEYGDTLGLVYSNEQSVRAALDEGAGVYWSRSRDELWRKGATSGDTQELVRIETDCDRDALLFIVRQQRNGFCHTGSRSCFGRTATFADLQRHIANSAAGADTSSYTKRILADPDLLARKLLEEAGELAEAEARDDVIWEAADLLYFTLTALQQKGVDITLVQRELERRTSRVRRRDGSVVTAGTATS